MKKLLPSVCMVLLCYMGFAKQRDTLTLSDMEIPVSPGFVLLDQAPSSIERPNTTKAFSLSVLNSFADGSGFPKNYAMELTPFWFFKSRDMNVLKYAGFDKEKARPFSSAKMISLSVAYVNTTDAITDRPLNNVAFGARTTLLKIYPKGHKEKVIKANLIAYHDLKGLAETLEREGATAVLKDKDEDEYNRIVQRVLDVESERDKLSPIEEVIKVKPLLAVDGAAAYNMFFVDNDFSTNRFGRFGAWTTLNLAVNLDKDHTNYLNFYTVGRYLADGTAKDDTGGYQTQRFVDFGGKLEFEFNRFSLGYEYIYRANGQQDTYRSTGQLRYRVSRNMYLTGAFGRNFGERNNLVSLLGINWGLDTGNEKAKIE